jgi:sulfatase maturation enzyme AslB (radical SAM superfamily)
MDNIIGKPYSIQVELTEGCNRLCRFCGLNGIKRAPFDDVRYMTVDTAQALAMQCASFIPNARYEFAMKGEPLLNNRAAEIFLTFRLLLPKAQMQLTTNGKMTMGRMQRYCDAIFDSGINFILLDTYRPERDELRREVATLQDVTVIDFYEDCTTNPWQNHHNKLQRTIFLMDDLGLMGGKKRNRTIFNHAGNSLAAPALSSPRIAKCTIPFREVNISYGGNFNICCMDFGSECVIGNIHHSDLESMWRGELMYSIRKLLYAKNRGFTPCARCDHPSGMRVGLLPKYPEPDVSDYQRVKLHIKNCEQVTKRNILPTEVLW